VDREFHFTKSSIDKVPTPKKSQVRYRDSKTNGLILRVTPAGNKVFCLYRWANGKPTQIKIGNYPTTTIDQARRQTQVLNGEITKGHDPIAERRKKQIQGITLQEVFDDYLQNRELTQNTLKDYKRSIKWGVGDWLSSPIIKITVPMVEHRHQELGLKSAARANNTMRVLRALCNYAQAKYRQPDGTPVIASNPVEFLSKTRQWFRIKRKTTLLKDYEIKPWLETVKELTDTKYPDLAKTASIYFQFLLFTGLRPTEGASLLWENVDFKEKSFKLLDTKNHESPEFPLTSFTFSLLKNHQRNNKSKYAFPSNLRDQPLNEFRTWVNKVREESGIYFDPHDLRRTYLTIAESLDISPTTVKRLANHRSGEHDVTTGYVVRDLERLRAPAQAITNRILELTI
jgi:integrase